MSENTSCPTSATRGGAQYEERELATVPVKVYVLIDIDMMLALSLVLVVEVYQ